MSYGDSSATTNNTMDEVTLNGILDAEIGDAVSYLYGNNSRIASDRAKAMDYYMGEPFGDERDGRSQVVSTDVQDTIESVLPSLLKIFFASDEIVQFQPVQQGDEANAKQATDYINYIFTKDNNGFLTFYTWFKDALLQRNGFVIPYWRMISKTETVTFTGLDENALAQLFQDESVELLAAAESQTANGMPAYDVKIRRMVKEGRICIDNIPPEYVIVSRGSRDLDTARISGYRVRKTISELIEEGFDPDDLQDIETAESYLSNTTEETARWRDEQGYRVAGFQEGMNTEDRSRAEVWVTVLYIKIDYDGDGIAELRRIIRAGGATGGKILANDEVDANDMCSLTPIPMPHKLMGRSIADLVMDIQRIKSTIQRQILDNMYLANNKRHKVRRGADVDLDALINSVPGGVVMMGDLSAVEPLDVDNIENSAFQFLEYEDSVREIRTGITRYNQGLDANSLNKTATGIQMIQGAAQQRLELIARVFAETGIVRLFKALLRLTIKHQDKARVIRLRDEWVSFDTRTWNADMDVSIAVGLGAGSREVMAGHYGNLIAMQEKLFPAGIVSKENLFNSASKLVENMGLKTPEMYFTDPQRMQQQQQDQQKPDPEAAKMQAQMQVEQQKMQMQVQGKQAELQTDMQKHAMSLQADKEIAAMKAQADIQTKTMMAQVNAKPTTQVQFDASGELGRVADVLQNIAISNQEAIQTGISVMAQAAQSMAMAAQQMSAPKVGTLSNGKTITIQTAPM